MEWFKNWFKRAPGVKIFIGIWLLVAVVPLWRLRAVRQWQSDQLMAFTFPGDDVNLYWQVESERSLTSQKAQQVASRFPGDLPAQLALLQEDWRRAAQSLDIYRVPSSSSQEEQARRARPEFERIFRSYAALAKRFPRDLSVRRQWMETIMWSQLPVESEALIASYFPNSPLPKRRVSWPSRAEQQLALQCALDSQKQEPDNAFWPWTVAIFQFSLRRDEEALGSLARAGRCARFDDGVEATAQARSALLARLQPVDFEDKWWEGENALRPHIAKMRSAMRAAMWQASRAAKRGDTQTALHIAELLQGAARPLLGQKHSFLTYRIGEIACYIAWRQTFFGSKVETLSRAQSAAERAVQQRQVVEKFAAFARRNGRSELAQSALRLHSSFLTVRFPQMLDTPQMLDNLPGDGPSQSALALSPWHWLSSWLLRMALAAAVVWILMFFASRREIEVPNAPAVRRSAVIWSAFLLGVTGAVLWGTLRLGVNEQIRLVFSQGNFGQTMRPAPNIAPLFWIVFPLFWLVPALATTRRVEADSTANPTQNSRKLGWLQLGLDATLLLLLPFVPGLLSVSTNAPLSRFWPYSALVFILGFCGACWLHFVRAPASRRLSVVILTAAASGWMSWLLINASLGDASPGVEISPTDYPSYPFNIAAISASLTIVGMVCWWRRIGLFNFRYRPFLAELPLRVRLFTATLALGATLAYFFVLLGTIPLRHHAQQQLDRQVRVGAVAFLEEQLQK